MNSRIRLILLFCMAIPFALHAQFSVDSLKNELNKAKEDTGKVILYRMLAGIVLNSEPKSAIDYAKGGIALGRKIGYETGVAGCYLNMATAFSFNGQLDSALKFSDSAIVSSKIVGDPNRLALVYLNRGDFHMQLSNYKQAIRDCDSAWHYAEIANNNDRRARILHTMGSINYYQMRYREAREFYDRAGNLYQENGNKRMYAIILNNLASLYSDEQDHLSALDHYHRAVALAAETGDKVNLPMYYGNMGNIYVRLGQYTKAEVNARKAMQYATEQNNQKQIGIAFTIFSNIYLKQKNYKNAIEAGHKAMIILEKNELLHEQETVAEILAEAYSLSGNHARAFEYLSKSKILGDSIARQRYDEDIAAMQTAFKVSEKNNEIEILNKNKELQQQEITLLNQNQLLQEQRLSRQRLLLFGSVVLMLLAAAGILLLVNRNKMKQRMKEMELRQTIAADLHDEVGSSISSIHMLSEMASGWETISDPQKEMLVKVASYSRETMDKMGDIVWMIKPATQDTQHLQERMERLLFELCSSKGIHYQIDVNELKQVKLSMNQKKAIYLIFKEAVNNALKYASPGLIDVSLSRKKDLIELMIKDDGKGFDLITGRKGNGLENMRNRAMELGGSLDIISAPGKGSLVVCRIPV